jgi:hypothetical protein
MKDLVTAMADIDDTKVLDLVKSYLSEGRNHLIFLELSKTGWML